eukprot:TRINITY_DN28032_c0_g1_i1.p2 TRINITY_DN28032_c0_g1~~TRINITY_DN28032_c0_g1_i1.p2  ORF type:complete len:561 (-),score=123.78 TRINITY_DN28032_c0_g1_i1:106-1788(-)
MPRPERNEKLSYAVEMNIGSADEMNRKLAMLLHSIEGTKRCIYALLDQHEVVMTSAQPQEKAIPEVTRSFKPDCLSSDDQQEVINAEHEFLPDIPGFDDRQALRVTFDVNGEVDPVDGLPGDHRLQDLHQDHQDLHKQNTLERTNRGIDMSHSMEEIMIETVRASQTGDETHRTCKGMVASLMSHEYFDYLIGAIIALNAVCIGIETQVSIDRDADLSTLELLEIAFLVIYTLEIWLRIAAFGKANLWDAWFRFDFTLVAMGYIGWVIEESIPNPDIVNMMDSIMLVRTFRLLRLIRALRMVKICKQMWRLVYGLTTSLNTMASTLGLCGLFLYMFGCVGVELITKDAWLNSCEDTKDIVAYNFGSLGLTILTLLQFVTMDSIAAYYYPLVVHKPLLIWYFVAVLLVVSISLMNLVTAVLVEGALANAAKDKEEEAKMLRAEMGHIVPKIMEIFGELDTDDSGLVTKAEIQKLDIRSLPAAIVDKVAADNMYELFDVLDADGTGELTKDEFVRGLLSIGLLHVPIGEIQSLKLAKSTRHRVMEVQEQLDAVKRALKISVG